MLAAGYHALPDNMIATLVTSLEMLEPAPLRTPPITVDLQFDRITPYIDAYRRLYRSVGGDWLWFSRLVMDDPVLAAILSSPDIEFYHLADATGGEGMLELDFRDPGQCELSFLGVTGSLIGGGAGRWLMNRAIERAWSRPIRRFWVHTCTLDHPSALGFYMRSGFKPFRLQVEVAPDPRLNGTLPEDAAPHVPLVRSAERTPAATR